MTLLEELKLYDLASDKPDNIFARVLAYVSEMEENSELLAKIESLEEELEYTQRKIGRAIGELGA